MIKIIWQFLKSLRNYAVAAPDGAACVFTHAEGRKDDENTDLGLHAETHGESTD
jgi:hypothetical protein